MKKNRPLLAWVTQKKFLKAVLIMKLSFLLIFLCVFQSFARTNAQGKISLNARQTEIEKLIRSIEKQSEFKFLYNYDLQALKKRVDITVKESPIQEALDKLLYNSGLKYKLLKDNLVVILSSEMEIQDIRITGKITGEGGEPLSGASVRVKGRSIGTSTDNLGNFSLTVPQNSVLEISYVGYQAQEVEVKGENVVNVIMSLSSKNLDQLVIVGYGIQKKSVVTGAISSVKANDLKNMPITRFEDALKGRTSGVVVASNSGQPGAASSVIIRGVTSINNSVPLYVVDGVPIDVGGIDYLNSGDIESIEILKDAASAAIYGTKAASGVILVTTKKGRSGGIRVNYSGYYGTQAPAKKLDLLNATQYATLRNESSLAGGGPILFSNPSSLGQGTDWQSVIFNNSAKIQNHDINFSGGNDKSSFYASFGYIQQDGIVATAISNYKRFTVRLNSTHKINKWLTFGENASYANIKSSGSFDPNGSFGGPLSSAINLDPITPVVVTDPNVINTTADYANHLSSIVRDANGNPYGISQIVGQEMTNPLAYIKTQEGNYGWSDAIAGNVFLEVQPINGLKIRSSLGTKLSFWGGESFSPIYFLSATNSSTTTGYNRSFNKGRDWIWTNTITYSRTFGVHNVTALIGTEANDRSGTYGVGGSFSGLPVNNFYSASLNFQLPATNRIAYGYEIQPYRLSSVFGRVNYDYDGKYLFTGIVRRDGSSHFGSNNVYGTFPSASVGWLPTRESFWPKNKTISYLKLRAGYGINGNDNLDPFRYVSTIGGLGTYVFGYGNITTGYGPSAPANPDLKWEQTSQTDIGFDANIFSNFTLTVDLFKKKTTGMLMQVKLPYYVGASSDPWGNVADMENKGVEVDLGYHRKFGEVGVDLKANASYVKNKVTNIGLNDFITNATFQASAYEISRKQVGQPVNSFYGFQSAGIFQTIAEVNSYTNKAGQLLQPNAKPGDFKWVDLNGDGVINDKDRTFLGDPTPHWTFGFTAGAQWKSFDIVLFGQGVAGNKIFQGLRRLDITKANYSTKALNRWTGPGTSNDFPRLVDGDPNGNFSYPSSFYLEDGSYLRLKTLQLGYTLPKKYFGNTGIQGLRVYISGNNLLTLTKYTGYDPEIGGGQGSYSIDRGIYPQARSFMAGINVTL